MPQTAQGGALFHASKSAIAHPNLQHHYVHIDTPNLHVLDLHIEVVFELPLLIQEVSIVSVVESQLVLGEWFEELGFSPIDVPHVSEGLGLNLEYSASSEEEELIGEIHEIPPVPDPCADDKGREVEEEAVPVPDQFEGVEDVVEDGEGDERLI